MGVKNAVFVSTSIEKKKTVLILKVYLSDGIIKFTVSVIFKNDEFKCL